MKMYVCTIVSNAYNINSKPRQNNSKKVFYETTIKNKYLIISYFAFAGTSLLVISLVPSQNLNTQSSKPAKEAVE